MKKFTILLMLLEMFSANGNTVLYANLGSITNKRFDSTEDRSFYLPRIHPGYERIDVKYKGVESMESHNVTDSVNCFDLDFMETWETGSFEDNNWIVDSANWLVNGQVGNPDPSAEFSRDPALTGYEASLISYPIFAAGMTEGMIWMDFDLKLDAIEPTGEELLQAQIWNWDTQEWNTLEEYSNANGSFDWTARHVNINAQAMGKVFKIRFHVTGVNSLNILGWFIDNIHVYRMCEGLTNLTATAIAGLGIVLDGDMPPGGGPVDAWIHWDDGVNYGNSIGGPLEFSVGARWTPEQLIDYEGASVIQISFFPDEPTATYKVRVWVGEEGANMVVDQLCSPISGQWNTVMLTTPVPIDITQELWVGYYINTPTGYPAGVDNGPAIDGYGNMIYFGGWQTLLEINPDLDYNWNIAAHIMTVAGVTMPLSRSWEPCKNTARMSLIANPSPIHSYQAFDLKNGTRELSGFNIYRNANGGDFVLLNYNPGNPFIDPDENLVPGTTYCYMVSSEWESETDLCESEFSNEACVLWTRINDPDTHADGLNLYPNPADDHVYITASENLKRVTVFNALGQLVLDEIAMGKQYELSTNSFNSGVFMIHVETSGGTTTRTLTIRR
jgi:hypothetical protein